MGKWYAVQLTTEDDWGYGSYNFEEAKRMLEEQGCGLIAVIEEGDDPICVKEIHYKVNEIFEEEEDVE